MTRHQTTRPASPDDRPGQQLARLRAVLALVESMAGIESAGAVDLGDGAALEDRYASAPGAARRRYDALAGETAAFAAAGIEALIRARVEPVADVSRPAARLAQEMRGSIRTMERLIRC